jgi:putative nucleotidyltransferase with HDIG domain
MNGRSDQSQSGNYIPIELHSLRVNSVLDFNLYIAVDGDYVLYRAPSMTFTEKTKETLIDHGQQYLFISRRDRRAYQGYIESHLFDIINDAGIDDTTKSTIVYTSARMLIQDLMEKPTLPENVQRGLALVETTALHLLQSRKMFYEMLKVMPFDYSMYTHSVNVFILTLMMARDLNIEDNTELLTIGMGALLHDVGKSRVPKEILDKRGPLTDAEMMIVKKHPQFGFEIIIGSHLIPHDAHFPVLQHHERENGSGYPHQLTSKEIHLYSKMVAISDAFDAMTTHRSYRNALNAFPALQEMYEDTRMFDRELLERFTRLMGASSEQSHSAPANQ